LERRNKELVSRNQGLEKKFTTEARLRATEADHTKKNIQELEKKIQHLDNELKKVQEAAKQAQGAGKKGVAVQAAGKKGGAATHTHTHTTTSQGKRDLYAEVDELKDALKKSNETNTANHIETSNNFSVLFQRLGVNPDSRDGNGRVMVGPTVAAAAGGGGGGSGGNELLPIHHLSTAQSHRSTFAQGFGDDFADFFPSGTSGGRDWQGMEGRAAAAAGGGGVGPGAGAGGGGGGVRGLAPPHAYHHTRRVAF
jgi:hypothetical protein